MSRRALEVDELMVCRIEIAAVKPLHWLPAIEQADCLAQHTLTVAESATTAAVSKLHHTHPSKKSRLSAN